MKCDWYSDKVYEYNLKELISEVIASKSARRDEQDDIDLGVGFLEIFPGLNQYKLNE